MSSNFTTYTAMRNAKEEEAQWKAYRKAGGEMDFQEWRDSDEERVDLTKGEKK